ncbi:MAG: hypothetical protein ACUVQ8_00020 [Nitrososphaeria archaeon]
MLSVGGIAVFIGPNTFEQCGEIVRRNKIDVDENAMLYGGQEEPSWNQHKAAFSVDYAVKLFKDAGFTKEEVKPLPGCSTDMIIEVYKGEVQLSPSALFSQALL